MRQGEKYAFIGGKERTINRKYDECVGGETLKMRTIRGLVMRMAWRMI